MYSHAEMKDNLLRGVHIFGSNGILKQDKNSIAVSAKELSDFFQTHFGDDEENCNLIDWFVMGFVNDLQNIIKPKFWAILDSCDKDFYYKFPAMIGEIHQLMQGYLTIVKKMQKVPVEENPCNIIDCTNCMPGDREYYHGPFPMEIDSNQSPFFHTFLQIFRSILLSAWPVNFRSVMLEYYNLTFRAFQACQKDVGEPTAVCSGCENQVAYCCCKMYLEEFSSVNEQLSELDLLESLLGDVPISVAQNYVEKFIKEMCNGSFEISYLIVLKNWLSETVLKWLGAIYDNQSFGSSYSSDFKTILAGYKDRLLHALYESYSEVRMDQMFSVIIEYPDSQPALEDLKECINVSGLRQKLVTTLRTAMETRLLHPGVNTSDILTAYISAIKALRVLDSSGVVLQLVCEPICKYLRTREDTVRCIVFSLTDDSCEELTSELMKGCPVHSEDTYVSDEDTEDWEHWMPDPVDADPTKTTKSQRSLDIISMLVDIYGSKEMFVNEYRTLLADRLLSTFSYNTEREIRYLELLKIRFGEAQLHYCEVMLKDVADSKRINNHLNSADATGYEKGDFPVNTMILSAQFWPAFKEEKIELPEYIWQQLSKYTAAFEALKGNRTLSWKPHLGTVEISIEFKERTVDLSVSPVHATILWHFQDQAQWTIEDLANVMKIQTSVLRRKITFWQSHGILKEEETDVFVLVEEQKVSNQEAVVMIEDETESVTASSQDQREEELQTFWSFIVGMLTNMESLPLERIHSMLRMFAMQGPNTNEFTIQGMKQFLDKKVRERKLLYSSGLYRLPRFES